MKSIIKILLLMLIINQASGQWIQQNSTTTKNLNEVKFVTESIGYVVGEEGILLKTINGGEEWNQISTGITDNLTALWLISSNTVFIGTSTGIVLKTNDGGMNWETLNISANHIYDIYFINNTTGFTGTNNSILKTGDGGENWIEVFVNTVPGAKTYEICFASNLVGYSLHAGILKTVDGGQNWIQIKDDDSTDYNGADILTSCVATTNNIAYFGSPYYGGIYKTTDGGENLTYKIWQVQALDFPTLQTGYASSIGDYFNAQILKTFDGGETWYTVYFEIEADPLNDIHFVNENKGWAVGWNGKILYTNNGGGVPPHILLQRDRIWVNQNLNCNEICIEGNFRRYNIKIFDQFNNTIFDYSEANNPLKINTSTFNDQLYYLTIQHQSLEDVRIQTILTSCNNETNASEPQFNLVSDSLLAFEYYYDWEGEWPVEVMTLQAVEDIEIDNKIYTGFDNLSLPKPSFDLNNEDGILDYNFPPIRYENGNYFERRGNKEVVVLKDNISIGDTWNDELIYENGDTSMHTFELVAYYETFNEFGIDYENVFRVKETFYFTGANSDQISLHYYNEENGIIRREIPQYISGTYGPIIFNRIQ